MKNKGIFKIWFSKPLWFIIKTTPCKIELEFTLSQCRVGWCKLMNDFQIHLLFLDIIIWWLPLKSKKIAREYIIDAKHDYEIIKNK